MIRHVGPYLWVPQKARLVKCLAFGQRACFSLTPSIRDSSQIFRHSEDLAQERYELRANEDVDKKRARLLYQSRKRGMLENGVILASFADKYLNKLNAEQLDQYDRLINLPTNDWDIFHWATKTKPTPPEFETTVMQQLRDHINSKVSSNKTEDECDYIGNREQKQQQKISILDGKDPDEIVLPAIKDKYDLDADPRQSNLLDPFKELYDGRRKTFRNQQYIENMTAWRKQHFLRRIKRTIPSPVSVRHLDEKEESEVFTQNKGSKVIASENAIQTDVLDSKSERILKHHNFLQHLMSSQFTLDPLDYDDEAEAWSEIIWHRNYGRADSKLAPSSQKCATCRANLHCCDSGVGGYLPKELFLALKTEESSHDKHQCQRCKFSSTYNDVALDNDVANDIYMNMCKELRSVKPAVICLLVDLTDLPSGIFEGIIDLIGTRHRLVVVGNKLDLLPNDGFRMIERVTYSFKHNLSKLRPGQKNLNIDDVMVMSAKTGFGVHGLVTRLLNYTNAQKDIYLIGCKNSGKSTLFDALLQSDLSSVRQGDLISRVSEYKFPGSELKMLRFPINLAEGWEIELKKRRSEIVERNHKKQEKSLESTTSHRQASMPHMSMLINRLEYLPTSIENTLVSNELNIKFSRDHPLADVPIEYKALSSNEENGFNSNSFFHMTPSTTNPDQIHDLLTNREKLEVFPNQTMIPRRYTLRPLQTIFVAGLARLDVLTSTSHITITILASEYLPIHVIPTRKADKFYNTFLGSPYLGAPFCGEDDPHRLRRWPGLKNSQTDFWIRGKPSNFEQIPRDGAVDIVLSSIGWALVNCEQDQDCIIRAHTPEGRGIYLREPPLLPFARNLNTGKKLRDTPLFLNPKFKIQHMPA